MLRRTNILCQTYLNLLWFVKAKYPILICHTSMNLHVLLLRYLVGDLVLMSIVLLPRMTQLYKVLVSKQYTTGLKFYRPMSYGALQHHYKNSIRVFYFKTLLMKMEIDHASLQEKYQSLKLKSDKFCHELLIKQLEASELLLNLEAKILHHALWLVLLI